jgi:hypothetical protein
MSDKKLRHELAEAFTRMESVRDPVGLAQDLFPWAKRKILEARIEELSKSMTSFGFGRIKRLETLKRELEALCQTQPTSPS